MRTTIELPDRLFREAKALSAANGETLKEFFTAALEQAVAERSEAEPRRMLRPPIRGRGPIPARTNAELASLLESEDMEKSS